VQNVKKMEKVNSQLKKIRAPKIDHQKMADKNFLTSTEDIF